MNLRDEIIEHAKARGELYKWKIILVAGLGYAASGLVGAPSPRERACLLAFIPWVCIWTQTSCVETESSKPRSSVDSCS